MALGKSERAKEEANEGHGAVEEDRRDMITNSQEAHQKGGWGGILDGAGN